MMKITKYFLPLFLCCMGMIQGIYAQASNDATLNSIGVSVGKLAPAFTADIQSYTVAVENTIDTIIIEAKATHVGATVSGNMGKQALKTGENKYTVTGTAEDGTTTKDYSVTVTRKPYMITASVKNEYGGTISPLGNVEVNADSNQQFTFTANEGYELQDILIDGVPDSTDAIEETAYTFTNIKANHTIEIFFVSTDAKLASLTVGEGILTPDFSPYIFNYRINVDKDVDSILIEAKTNHEKAGVLDNTNKQALVSGDNDYFITCRAENNNELVYQINVVRSPYEITSSTKNNYGGFIEPNGTIDAYTGSESGYTYTISAKNDYIIKNVLVDGVTNDEAIQNGTYTFNKIDANHTIEAIFASTEARLTGISVSSGILNPVFHPDTYSYTVTAASSVSTISITGVLYHSATTIANINSGALTTGENTFELVTTAEDGKTKKTYTLIVNRDKSTDAALSGLFVSEGSLSPLFNSNTIEYTVHVANNIDEITITGTARDNNATITGNVTNGALSTDGNTFELNVTAEDGSTTKKYTIYVIRAQSSDANLKSLIVEPGILSPAFNESITNYVVNLDYAAEYISITGEAKHAGATVTGNVNSAVLIVGSNLYHITITAEDGTVKKYTITVVRAKSSDATVSNLTVSTGTLSPEFNVNTTHYTVNVSNEVEAISINGTVNNSQASITGNVTNAVLVPGENTFNIRVTAQSGATKTYTITVTRGKSSDAALRSLIVSNGSLKPGFNASIINYTVNVAHHISTITLTGITNNEKATVSGNVSNAQLFVGNNSFSIEVTAEDGKTTKSYNIIVTRAKSSDATLVSLLVSKGELTPAFNANITEYTINVEYGIDSISITGEATHEQAVVVGNVIYSALYLGNNVFKIIVTAANGSTIKTYTINVIRGRSKDADLGSLVVSNSFLIPEFNVNTTEYIVNVENSVESITITGTSNHPEANVTENIIDGKLSPGENTFTIKVMAEDRKTMKTYSITVIRTKSTLADLQNLTLSKGSLTPAFSPEITNYTAEVSDNVTTISINGIVDHKQATVKGNIMGAAIEIGENTFDVVVTAENSETTKTYTIVVTRKKIIGIDDTENGTKFTLYPNPVNDILFIKSSKPIQCVQVYDVYGKIVKSVESENYSLDISNLPKGVYLIKIITLSGETVKKIIKK